MKKLLGISLVAVLAVSPLMAKAEGTNPTAAGTASEPYLGKDITDTDRQATASAAYVKGAYNAAIGAVNAVRSDTYTKNQVDQALDAKVSNAGNFAGETDSTLIKEKTVVGAIKDIASAVDTLDANAVKSVTTGDAQSGNGTIKVNGQAVSVYGLGSAAYTNSNAYDAAGAASTAETNAKAYTDTEIQKLDATASQTAGADGLALTITEVDGKITAISGSIAGNTYDAAGTAANAIADLDVVATHEKGADGLELSITQEDGKIKAVSGSIAPHTYDAYGAAANAVAALGNVATQEGVENTIETATYSTSLNSGSTVTGYVPVMVNWGDSTANNTSAVALASGTVASASFSTTATAATYAEPVAQQGNN